MSFSAKASGAFGSTGRPRLPGARDGACLVPPQPAGPYVVVVAGSLGLVGTFMVYVPLGDE